MTDLALLVARLVLGLAMAAHGAQKLLGWFGGPGLAGTSGFFDALGFRPGRLFAFTASASEVGSGVLIAAGLLGPIGPALVITVMIVAGASVHGKSGFFAQSGGYELTVIYSVGALILAFVGPGQLSLDAVLGLSGLWTPMREALVVGLAVVGGVMNLAARRAVPAQA